jgi:hypothetical protein
MQNLSFTAFLRFLAIFKTEELDKAIENIAHHIKQARTQQEAWEPVDLDYLIDMTANEPERVKRYTEEMLESWLKEEVREDENRYRDWLWEQIIEIVL